MSALPRRRALIRLGGILATAGTAVLMARYSQAEDPIGRVIEIEARRFRYSPNEIIVKQGEVVILTFRAVDFTHGFSVPDLNVRVDLIAGQITPVRLQPITVGRFPFLCDNFCGDGHEEMHGTLTVEA